MKELKIENLCNIYNTDNDEVMFSVSDLYNFNDNVIENNTYYQPSFKINTYHLFLKQSLKNVNFEKEAINLMIENNIDDTSLSDDILKKLKMLIYYDIKDLTNETNFKKFVSKLVSNGYSIAMNSRIGPAHSVILPFEFHILYDLFMTHGYYFKVYYTKYLSDKIIIFRKNDDDNIFSQFKLIKNDDKYVFFLDKDYYKQYNIINIYSKKQERINKIKKLII